MANHRNAPSTYDNHSIDNYVWGPDGQETYDLRDPFNSQNVIDTHIRRAEISRGIEDFDTHFLSPNGSKCPDQHSGTSAGHSTGPEPQTPYAQRSTLAAAAGSSHHSHGGSRTQGALPYSTPSDTYHQEQGWDNFSLASYSQEDQRRHAGSQYRNPSNYGVEAEAAHSSSPSGQVRVYEPISNGYANGAHRRHLHSHHGNNDDGKDDYGPRDSTSTDNTHGSRNDTDRSGRCIYGNRRDQY